MFLIVRFWLPNDDCQLLFNHVFNKHFHSSFLESTGIKQQFIVAWHLVGAQIGVNVIIKYIWDCLEISPLTTVTMDFANFPTPAL